VDTPGLWIIRVPAVAVAQRAILEALVMQSLVGAVAGLLDIAAEDFVFHNADTKVAAESGAVAETQSEPGSEPRVGA
jgi:glucosamine--fructose-6-phosphate aminotransferase (isomerizing)